MRALPVSKLETTLTSVLNFADAEISCSSTKDEIRKKKPDRQDTNIPADNEAQQAWAIAWISQSWFGICVVLCKGLKANASERSLQWASGPSHRISSQPESN